MGPVGVLAMYRGSNPDDTPLAVVAVLGVTEIESVTAVPSPDDSRFPFRSAANRSPRDSI